MKNNDEEFVYEERVVLFEAENFDEAVDIAESEAMCYAEEECGEYLGFVNVYSLFSDDIFEITEVYSSMRRSGLNKDDYIDKFYDTGGELCNKIPSHKS
jgi:hypothetical protein